MKNLFMNILLNLVLIKYYVCDKDSVPKSSITLPNFRKKVEELSYEKPTFTKTKDTGNNLVSFLVKNVKEIFGKSEDPTVLLELENENDETTLGLRKTVSSTTTSINQEEGFDFITEEKDLNESSTEHTETPESAEANITDFVTDNVTSPKNVIRDVTETSELLNLSKDLMILQKAEQAERENQALELIDSSVFNKSSLEKDSSPIRRSCIFCSNVAVMDCFDPKNKLIPSIVCEREEDLCYSQHTPFGIVDRGCFNVNHNITTYVCSCNLCNYISISEMPFIFSTKRDWVENVIEMSRTKRLRNSVFKDMSCLRCEVNTSTKSGDMLDNANCLEGNVGTLPIQECAENEICGVKAIRSEGYIWRGCVTKPLYNYWWTLCDSDLCNYDSLVSIYDEL